MIGGGDFAKDRIIPDCVRAAMGGKEMVVRNPHSIRPYQHVLECLAGYLLLAKMQYENKKYAGTYNFGPDEEGCISTGELVQQFCDTWGDMTWRVQGDGGPHEANFLKLDCSKAKSILGWKPQWDIKKAIIETVGWTKGNRDRVGAAQLTDEQIASFYSSDGF